MLSSLKIVYDSFSKIVHYTYYLTRDLIDWTKFSIFVIKSSMDSDISCFPCLNNNASLFWNTMFWFRLTPSCTIFETVSNKFSTTALLASIASVSRSTTVSITKLISSSVSEIVWSSLWRSSRLPSGNYRVWIHSETRMWHDKNIQSNAPYR